MTGVAVPRVDRAQEHFRPLRIAMIIGSANRGGAEGQLVALARELSVRGHAVHVHFVATGGPLLSVLDAAGVPWTVYNDGRRPGSDTARAVLAVTRLAAALVRSKPDVVHAWLAGAVAVGLPPLRLLSRAVRIAAFRGQVKRGELGPLSPLMRSAVRHAHVVTVNAEWLVSEATDWGADQDRVVLIENAVTIPPRPARPSKVPATGVVVANFHVYKGHDVLFQALTMLDEPPCIRLIGSGKRRDAVVEQVHKMGLADVVEFVDFSTDVADELARAQFAVHPSLTEGMSNAVLEQIAAGLPVIATDVGAARVLVHHEQTGLIVPPGDAVALAAAIRRIVSDPSWRAQLGAAAREHAETFSWSRCTDRYEALYRTHVAERRHQRATRARSPQ